MADSVAAFVYDLYKGEASVHEKVVDHLERDEYLRSDLGLHSCVVGAQRRDHEKLAVGRLPSVVAHCQLYAEYKGHVLRRNPPYIPDIRLPHPLPARTTSL